MRSTSSKTLLFFTLLAAQPAAAGVRVGNGGDAFQQYLEAARGNIVFTLVRIDPFFAPPDNRPMSHELISHDMLLTACGGGTPAGRLCAAFIEETAAQIYGMGEGEDAVEVLASDERLIVRGEEVDGATASDSHSPIYFSRPRYIEQDFKPELLVGNMVHEFGHKVTFRGGMIKDLDPVRDESGVVVFARGEVLLNTVGTAVVKLLKDLGGIAEDFVTVDYFECKVFKTVQGERFEYNPIEAHGRRSFLSDDRSSYVSGFGFDTSSLPGNRTVHTVSGEIIRPKMRVYEQDNCQNVSSQPAESNDCGITRLEPGPMSSNRVPCRGEHIMCGRGNVLEWAYQEVSFSCQFIGSEIY